MPDKVDWDIVRPSLRKMSAGDLLAMLGRAWDLLPEDHHQAILGRWVPLERFREEAARLGTRTLHQKAIDFHRASVEGEYYEPFTVNSRNCTELSGGTEAWMDEALILFERATAASRAGELDEACAVFELLWDLFDRVDRVEDIIFFGDEHASWHVPVDYRAVLPAYFHALAATVTSTVFGARVLEIIERHDRGQRDEQLSAARALRLSDEHREALEQAVVADDERRLARGRR